MSNTFVVHNLYMQLANDLTKAQVLTLIASFSAAAVSLLAVLVTAGVAIWSNHRLSKLEKLKYELDQSKLLTSTRWKAEFNAYETLWKALVPVRASVVKLTHREAELSDLGVSPEDIPKENTSKQTIAYLQKLAGVLEIALLACNENAPFCDQEIRKIANRAHDKAVEMLRKHVAAEVASLKQIPADRDTQEMLRTFIILTDQLENMIRERLNSLASPKAQQPNGST